MSLNLVSSIFLFTELLIYLLFIANSPVPTMKGLQGSFCYTFTRYWWTFSSFFILEVL